MPLDRAGTKTTPVMKKPANVQKTKLPAWLVMMVLVVTTLPVRRVVVSSMTRCMERGEGPHTTSTSRLLDDQKRAP